MITQAACFALLLFAPAQRAQPPAEATAAPPVPQEPAPAVDAPSPAPAEPVPVANVPSAAPAAPAPVASNPAPATPAPVLPPELSVAPRAQVRVRGESIGDKTLTGAPAVMVLTHRARIGLDAQWKDRVRMVLEFQDVRAWGSETVSAALPPDETIYGKTVGSVDLHQGWASINAGPVEFRLGRQELLWSNERLLGPVDFNQLGRSFDAVRVGSQAGQPLAWMAFASIVRDGDVQPALTDLAVYGLALEHKVLDAFRYAPILLVEAGAPTSSTPLQRGTLGARVDGQIGAFGYDLEGYGQSSWLGRKLAGAFLAGGRLTWEFDTLLHPKIGVFTDYLSGGDPVTDDIVTFSPTYGTNHRYYGFQDFFLNIPLQTANQGIVDFGPTLWTHEGMFTGIFALHGFAASAYKGSGSAMYGVEPDLVARMNPWAFLGFELGTSVFVPVGDALGRGDQVTPWVYATVDAKL